MMWHDRINLLQGYHRHRRRKIIFAILILGTLVLLGGASLGFEAYRLAKLDRIMSGSHDMEKHDAGALEVALQQDYQEKLYWEEIRAIDAGVVPFADKIKGLVKQLPPSVQLESLELSRPGQLIISGVAVTGEDCVSYYRQLSVDSGLANVFLLRADRQLSGIDGDVAAGYRFVIQSELIK